MYPTLIETPFGGVHAWGVLVMLAFLGAFGVLYRRAPTVGIDPDRLVPLMMVLTGSALLGARLLHFVFAEPALLLDNPLAFFSPGQGGWAFYGGLIGGAAGALLYARRVGLPPWKLADTVAPTVMLGLAIGRLGCFFAGCCHGAVCPLPAGAPLLRLPYGDILAVDGFPWVALRFLPGAGVGALRGEVLYPTQLLEVAFGLLWFGLLSLAWARFRRFDGQILAMMLVLYAASRAWVETFRGDTLRGLHAIPGLGMSLSTSQIVALAMVLTAAGIAAWRGRAGRAPEQPFVAPEGDDAEG